MQTLVIDLVFILFLNFIVIFIWKITRANSINYYLPERGNKFVSQKNRLFLKVIFGCVTGKWFFNLKYDWPQKIIRLHKMQTKHSLFTYRKTYNCFFQNLTFVRDLWYSIKNANTEGFTRYRLEKQQKECTVFKNCLTRASKWS